MESDDKARWHRATQFASTTTSALGSFPAILIAVGMIVAWLVTGPLFAYSDTWQLVINTSTTIITFIMVFVIQNTANRDGRAIQTKLDALIESLEDADDRLVGIEDLPEHTVKAKQDDVRSQSEPAD